MNIDRILKKKKLTGDEIGKLIILNIAHTYKQALNGETPSQLFTDADLKKAISTIDNPIDGQRYNRYIGLNNFLQQYQCLAIAYERQVDSAIQALIRTLVTAQAVEETRDYIGQLPLIMTEKQYNNYRAEKIQAQLVDKNGEPLAYNVFNLLNEAISGLMTDLAENPRKKNPLKPIKKKYQRAKVTSKRILSRYNEVMGEGYYTLEDGRRSDEMTNEEWQKAITTPKMQKMLEALREYRKDNASQQLDELLAERIDEKALLEKSRILYVGGSVEDAEKAYNEIEQKLGYYMPAKWHYYDNPPEDLTKWDILELDDMGSFYPVLYGADASKEEFLEELKDFIAEFKELVDAVLADIDSRHFKGEKGLAELPLEKWETTIYDFKQLYEKDFYHFRSWIESDTTLFDGNYRAIFNGIALLKPASVSKHKLDKNGYFIDPAKDAISYMSCSFGLEQYTSENPDYIERLEDLERAREEILQGFKWLYGYNMSLELTADYIALPEMQVFRCNIEALESKADALNGLIPLLYRHIFEHWSDNDTEKARKLEVLKDNFTPLNFEKYKTPPASVLAQAKASLKDLECYRYQNGALIDILTEYDDSELEADTASDESEEV